LQCYLENDVLVPQDEYYRKVNELLDLRFVYKLCEEKYGTTGNPSIDPVVFFKMQIYGYLENITSDRKLVRRISDNLSARLFVGYDIDEELPWHSTISRTRQHLGEKIFEEVFNYILTLCVDTGKERLAKNGLTIKEVSADKGYFSGENLQKLELEGIIPYIPHQKFPNKRGGIDKKEFIYDKEKDCFICPAKKELQRSNKRRQKKLFG